MGCSKVPHRNIDPLLAAFLKQSGIQHVLKVPVRMRGLTSTGSVGHCYSNVMNLVEVFGGSRVIGWVYQRTAYRHFIDSKSYVDGIAIHLIGHAVWLNDKGKLSDVTAKSWLLSRDWSAFPRRDDDGHYVDFVPWLDSTAPHISCEQLDLIGFDSGNATRNGNAMLRVVDGNGTITREAYLAKIDRSFAERYFVSEEKKQRSKSVLADQAALSAYKRNTEDFGHFSGKSLITGKSLSEIRNKRKSAANKPGQKA